MLSFGEQVTYYTHCTFEVLIFVAQMQEGNIIFWKSGKSNNCSSAE